MNASGMIVLRVVHIVSGSLWVGGAVVNAVILLPAIMASGPAAGPVMKQIVQVRKLPQFMSALLILMFLSGLAMMGSDSAGFSGAWFGSPFGMALSAGALLAIIAAGVGGGVAGPAAKKLGALAAQIAGGSGPPAPEQAAEMQRLQGKLIGAARAVALLATLAVVAMASARYL